MTLSQNNIAKFQNSLSRLQAKYKQKILHATLEYKKRVGGVGAVTTGLLPALIRQGEFDVSIVTPFYDIYADFYKDKEIVKIDTVTHIYKGKQFKSDIFRVCTENVDGVPLYHYMIRPESNIPLGKISALPVSHSPVGRIFDIGDEKHIYQALAHSEPSNRLEYFNGALAAMIRMPSETIPTFDILHAHTWHTSLASVLLKLMDKLPKYQEIISDIGKPFKKIPYVISTVHMLLEREHGQLTTTDAIKSFLFSLGLPEEFTSMFPRWRDYLNTTHFKRLALASLYSDQLTGVSEGLITETVTGKGQGLDDLFVWFHERGRLQGILNGIPIKEFDPTNEKNLGEFTFGANNVVEGKQRLKDHLSTLYPQLDPNKMWFGFVGRLAQEKGVDMLTYARRYIHETDGVFIVLCSHVAFLDKDKKIPQYKELVEELRKHPNVLVIDDLAEQKRVGKLFRAAWDCTTLLSHNEACGLPQIEGFQFGDIAIGPRIQGVVDSIKSLTHDPINGTGFLYGDEPDKRKLNLRDAIHDAAVFYQERHTDGTMGDFLRKLIERTKMHDWAADPANKYLKLYRKVLNRPLLTHDKIIAAAAQEPTEVTVPTIFDAKPIKDALNNNTKIFVIGPNKCGTTTLYHWMQANKIKSVHYGVKGATLAGSMTRNYYNDLPLLGNEFKDFTFFSDMEDIYAKDKPIFAWRDLYQELDKQYPGSVFILNTRDKNNWIASRLAHVDPMNKKRYVDVLCQAYGITEQQLIKLWEQEWDDHHQAVREYFKDRPQDFIEFDIEKDPPEKLAKFYKDRLGINLDVSLYNPRNQTTAEMKQEVVSKYNYQSAGYKK